MAGFQVALVCPTTLLARQHFTNFVERFKGFPVNIGRLSRLVPAAEAQQTRDGLADGPIDIVVGNHAVLAKSADVKTLGLAILDDKPCYCVLQKEMHTPPHTAVQIMNSTLIPHLPTPPHTP